MTLPGPRAWGAILLAIAIAVLIATTAIRSQEGYAATGPRFVPLLVGAALLVLSILYVARPSAEVADPTTDWGRPAAVVVGLIGYVLLLEPLGYVVATALFFPAVARVLGSRSTLRDVLAGVALGVVLFVGFTEFLGVDLPPGLTPIT